MLYFEYNYSFFLMSQVCIKGRIHIFKWLESKSIKDGRNRGSSWKFNSLKSNNHSLDSNMDSLTLSETTSLVHSSDEVCVLPSINILACKLLLLITELYFQGANGSMEYLNKPDRKHRETNRYNNNARYCNIILTF